MSRNLKKGLIFTIFLFIFMLLFFFKGYFSDNVKTLIVVDAKRSSMKLIEEIINEEVVNKKYNFFYESVDSDGVKIMSFDSIKANLLLSSTLDKLESVNEEMFIVEVPASYLFAPTSYIFSDLKLKVESKTLIYYDLSLKTNIKEYGINNSLVELIMVVDIKYQVYAPMMVNVSDNQVEIPLSINLINGKVPEGLFSY